MQQDWIPKTIRRPMALRAFSPDHGWIADQVCPTCKGEVTATYTGIRVIQDGREWVCVTCGTPAPAGQEIQRPDAAGVIRIFTTINGALRSNPFLTPPAGQFKDKIHTVPDDPDDAWKAHGRTELGNSQRLVMLHGDKFRYVSDLREFLVYDGFRWLLDKTGAMERFAKNVVESIYQTAVQEGLSNEEGKKWLQHANSSSSRGKIESMIQLTRSHHDVALTPDDLDRPAHLLNCLSGTVDLSTGALQEHAASDYLTKLAPVEYDPDAECPLWDTFIHDTLASGDPELATWLQKMAGYIATGDNSEQVFFLLFGNGMNGKSKFLEVITKILGDYATTASFDLFLRNTRSNVEHGLADLRGARMVTAMEAPQGTSWNEPLIKTVTGQDSIRASKKYQNSVAFVPVCKVVFTTNYLPHVNGRDNGFWRRLVAIPCRTHVATEDRDGQLAEKLLQEATGIFAWMVRGAILWHMEGLTPYPEAIEEALKEYKDDSDLFSRFIEESGATIAADEKTAASEILRAYNEFQKENSDRPLNHRSLNEVLKHFRGGILRRQRGPDGRWYWHGITVVSKSTMEKEDAFARYHTPHAGQSHED